jgi:histidinol-phosphate aminotransferase
MSRYWSSLVHRLTPYVPGEQPKLPNLVKLNTNENPYPPSAQVLVAIADELANGGRSLRLYPDPNADRLKEAVAARYADFGIRPQQVFVGNGSDEVLAHIFPALLKHTLPVLFPDITYSFYPVYCGLYDIAYRTVALDEEFTIRVEDYAMANGGIIFPNPNAPTGCLLPLADIERLLLLHRESVVVVDEAYVDFGGDSAIALVDRHPNLLVVHTLSKSRSLAGLRVGYAVGQNHLTEALERVKNSFNSYPLDRLAIAGAVAAIDDQAYFELTRQAVIDSREALRRALLELGFTVLSVGSQLHLRQPPAARCRRTRRRPAAMRHHRSPLQVAAYRPVPADYHRHRRTCELLVEALRNILI